MAEIVNNGDKFYAQDADIKLIEQIGAKLADKYIDQLSEDNIKIIYKAISEEIFVNSYDGNPQSLRLQVTDPDSYYGNKKDALLWKMIKQQVARQFSNKITSKVDEIIASDQFNKKADEIAEELVEYATNGYKSDMKERIRQRLVNNVLENEPVYFEKPLKQVIVDTVAEMMNGHY